MKFFTVIAIHRKTKKEMPPRYDLAPMNHAAACNFMDACRTQFTDYKIHEWPSTLRHSKTPVLAKDYRKTPLS